MSAWRASRLVNACIRCERGIVTRDAAIGKRLRPVWIGFDSTGSRLQVRRSSALAAGSSATVGSFSKELTPAKALLSIEDGARVVLAGWLINIRIVSSDLAFAVLLLPRGQGRLQLISRRQAGEGSDKRDRVAAQWERAGLHSVVQVEGTFAKRPQKAQKANDALSQYELQVEECSIVNAVANGALPFNPTDVGRETREEVRLRNRHLDLRNPDRGENIRLRSRVTFAIRNFLHEQGFDEIETPILLRSTPEGAREYLVPTRLPVTRRTTEDEMRLRPQFYALQQSPQQPKQLLVIGGVTDRYFQIARCFRDEDGRKDRQPEFTQIDLEMSFVLDRPREHSDWPLGAEEVRWVAEGLIKRTWQSAKGAPGCKQDIPDKPFRVMSYDEAMKRFGSDKPDLRYGMEIGQLGSVLLPHRQATGEHKHAYEGEVDVLCFTVPEKSDISRSMIDRLLTANSFSNQGIEMFWGEVGAIGDLAKIFLSKSAAVRKFLTANGVTPDHASSEEVQGAIQNLQRSGLPSVANNSALDKGGRICLFAASRKSMHPRGGSTLIGEVRRLLPQLLEEKGLLDMSVLAPQFVWIVEFPLFTREDQDKNDLSQGRWSSSHHPFTNPASRDAGKVKALLQLDPTERTKDDEAFLENVKGQHYDLVLNGVEIGGGSVRIHDAELQRSVFSSMLALSDDELGRFSHILSALQHGAPPHAGIALGLDRLMAILCGSSTIRDVIAFPKTLNGRDLLFGSPDSLQEHTLETASEGIKVQTVDAALDVYGLRQR